VTRRGVGRADTARNRLASRDEAGSLAYRHQAALRARVIECRAVRAQDEALEFVMLALPLGYRSSAHFALDGAPETPGPLGVPALHGSGGLRARAPSRAPDRRLRKPCPRGIRVPGPRREAGRAAGM
jgi:hypothetical protein